MSLSPRAPPPHPPPSPPCPAVTRVLAEEDYRAGATALSVCWRPLVVHLRTITMLMGLGGPERWRISTLSTKSPSAVFCDVFSGLDETQRGYGTSCWNVVLFVCLFVFRAIHSFLWFEKGGEMVLISMSVVTKSLCGSLASLQTENASEQATSGTPVGNGDVETKLEIFSHLNHMALIHAPWPLPVHLHPQFPGSRPRVTAPLKGWEFDMTQKKQSLASELLRAPRLCL